MRIIQSLAMTREVEDWSRVRSPSRAARRLKQGHRQNVRLLQVPRKDCLSIDGGQTFVMHPETYRACAKVIERFQEKLERSAFGGPVIDFGMVP